MTLQYVKRHDPGWMAADVLQGFLIPVYKGKRNATGFLISCSVSFSV